MTSLGHGRKIAEEYTHWKIQSKNAISNLKIQFDYWLSCTKMLYCIRKKCEA